MEPGSRFSAFLEGLRERAGVERVYGEPIEREGRTVVPVARVAYGFGGGFGAGAAGPDDESETEATDHSEGGGGGGGALARPVGVIEITAHGTRFVPVRRPRRVLGVLVAGALLGYLLGWVMWRHEHDGGDV